MRVDPARRADGRGRSARAGTSGARVPGSANGAGKGWGRADDHDRSSRWWVRACSIILARVLRGVPHEPSNYSKVCEAPPRLAPPNDHEPITRPREPRRQPDPLPYQRSSPDLPGRGEKRRRTPGGRDVASRGRACVRPRPGGASAARRDERGRGATPAQRTRRGAARPEIGTPRDHRARGARDPRRSGRDKARRARTSGRGEITARAERATRTQRTRRGALRPDIGTRRESRAREEPPAERDGPRRLPGQGRRLRRVRVGAPPPPRHLADRGSRCRRRSAWTSRRHTGANDALRAGELHAVTHEPLGTA